MTCESVVLVKRSPPPEQTCSPTLSQKKTGKRVQLRPEPRERKPKNHDYLCIFFARKQKKRSYDFLSLSRYDLMTCAHQDSPNKSSTPSHPPRTQNNIAPTQTKPSIFNPPHLHPHHHLPCRSTTLPRTKPSVRLPISYATMARTGTNFAPTPLVLQGKPRSPHRCNAKYQNTRPPRPMVTLLMNHSSK
jgi:hypothetical protein